LSRAGHPGVLRSACNPCRQHRLTSRLWTRQRPRFFRFPVRSARWIGPANGLSICHPRRFIACTNRLSLHRSWSWFSRLMTRYASRAAGQIMVYYHPCLRHTAEAVFSLGQTGPPGLTFPGSVPQLHDNPGAPQSCARSPARLPTGIQLTCVSRTFSSQFLSGPPARPVFLSRDSAACLGSTHFTCPGHGP